MLTRVWSDPLACAHGGQPEGVPGSEDGVQHVMGARLRSGGERQRAQPSAAAHFEHRLSVKGGGIGGEPTGQDNRRVPEPHGVRAMCFEHSYSTLSHADELSHRLRADGTTAEALRRSCLQALGAQRQVKWVDAVRELRASRQHSSVQGGALAVG